MRIEEHKLKATTTIRKALMADAYISEAVGNRIYPCLARQDKGNYIVITRGAMEKDKTKLGVSMPLVSVLVEVYAEDYDDSIDIALSVDRVMTSLYNENTNQPDNKTQLLPRFLGAVEAYSGGKFLQAFEYEV